MCGQLNGHDNLIKRVRVACDKHGISFATDDGVIDSTAFLLSNFNNNNRQMLPQLLLPF